MRRNLGRSAITVSALGMGCWAIGGPYHGGENLIEQLPTGEWIERAQYFEAVATTGEGVFDTLKAVSKLVLKSLA